jgi:hypothetical protein
VKPGASPARGLCGALVGLFSGLLATTAHVWAGGALPAGSSAVLLWLVCAAVGGVTCAGAERLQPTRLAAGLLAGQAVGHLVLTATAHHGHGHAWGSTQMAAAHVTAAVALGALIGLVGHLCVVIASVLSWLRLIAVSRVRVPARRWPSIPPMMRRRLPAGGTRTRAPPIAAAALG